MVVTQESSNKKVRVSLDLSAPFHERLDALEKLTQAESKAGVIRQALQVYEYVARKTAEGYSFRAIGPDGKEENLVFFSPYVPSLEELEARR
jgi:hypothetical protein